MTDSHDIKTKALIFEHDGEADNILKELCQSHSITGLKASNPSTFDLLNSNTDLGAVFVSDKFIVEDQHGESLVKTIHKLRPELPIFYRVEDTSSVKALTPGQNVSCVYQLDKFDCIEQTISKHIFSTHYPTPLVQGMKEISLDAIQSNIRNCVIEIDSPYLVKDQIIYGELMSLIPIESSWYRGYMMLQTTEAEVISMIENGMTPLNPKDTDFRFVNSLLNEIANMIWGGIKRKFADKDNMQADDSSLRTQVPISVNHFHKYISFGTTEPQLCFHYRIKNEFDETQCVELYQKFVFNLAWLPENFQETNDTVEEMVDSGELELF
ncbi:chemotaxis protein CheX [Aliikangiella marina]|uniref:Chemotaxis protein CheX n=1 Tax=Aliikangiella marina TaxID=1712262 RepID=A0A545T6B3_9GAMM|nr:chemotaxis protein CheX [Aliikangiella marina]TQV72770.1 chemotaxis protein CheX [Aliikangiella marina]